MGEDEAGWNRGESLRRTESLGREDSTECSIQEEED